MSKAWQRTPVDPETGVTYGFIGLAVDGSNPNTLLVSTMGHWWPDDNLYRSIDGGATWTRLWTWGDYPNHNLRYVPDISISPYLAWGSTAQWPELSPKLGWMIGDLEIDPFHSDRMLIRSP